MFYRGLFETAAPGVAGLPSTNDTPKPSPRDRKSLSAQNMAGYAEIITASFDAMRLLPDDLADLIADPDRLAVDPRRGAWVRILKGARVLSAWQRRWSHRVRDIGQAPW